MSLFQGQLDNGSKSVPLCVCITDMAFVGEFSVSKQIAQC